MLNPANKMLLPTFKSRPTASSLSPGCLFSARRGHGAWAQALWDPAAPQQRITVDDSLTAAESRFMESYESRHSSHSVTAAVVGGD